MDSRDQVKSLPARSLHAETTSLLLCEYIVGTLKGPPLRLSVVTLCFITCLR